MQSYGTPGRRVAIIAGVRTPFARSGTTLKGLSAIELGKHCVAELIQRTEMDGKLVDAIVYGTVVPSVLAPNIAREVSLLPMLPKGCQAFTVSRACASANQAITDAADQIALGHADVIIAGGAESLSNVPILHSRGMSDALVAASRAKSLGGRVKALARVRPRDLVPITPAIAEPSTGESMGESAEKMAKINAIPRELQDQFALRSHRLAAAGTHDGRLTAEIVPLFVPPDFQAMTSDNGIRSDTSIEQLRALKPVFDRRNGTVTAGNSSPLSDGASMLLLGSEAAAERIGSAPLARVVSRGVHGVDPDVFGIAPVEAANKALAKAGLTWEEVDAVELNEAFASQSLACLAGWPELDPEKVNMSGGAIAIGHPLGASGARVLGRVAEELRARGGRYGLAALCIGVGQGLAMVVEVEG